MVNSFLKKHPFLDLKGVSKNAKFWNRNAIFSICTSPLFWNLVTEVTEVPRVLKVPNFFGHEKPSKK
jgi:hypothetical protein